VRAACALGDGLSPTITVVALHVAPYGQPLDHSAVSVAWRVEQCARLAAEFDCDLTLRAYICRPGGSGLAGVLAEDAVIVVGGARNWPKKAPEQRLIERLEARGGRVLFVDYNGSVTKRYPNQGSLTR
jgi:hypothetical protein